MRLVFLVLLCLFSFGCGTNRLGFTSTSDTAGGVATTINWMKHKKYRIDASITIVNNYPFEVVVSENAITCFVDGVSGIARKTNGRATLKPGERRQYPFVYDFENNIAEGRELKFQTYSIYRGERSTAVEGESYGKSNASAVAYGNVAVGFGSSKAKGITYEKLSFKEGEKLPTNEIAIDLTQYPCETISCWF